LRGDLLKQLNVLRRESVEAATGEIERAESVALRDERYAADALQAFFAKSEDDFTGVTIQFGSAREERLPGGNGGAGGRGIARDRNFLFEETLVAGKIERMNLEQTAGGIQEREAGVIVMNDAL